MGPKKVDRKKANVDKKKGGRNDKSDFDAVLAEAVAAANDSAAQRPPEKNKNALFHSAHGESDSPRSMAADIKPVPSSADHPDNPYPMPPTDVVPPLPRQTWPEPTIPIRLLYSTQPTPHYPKGLETEHPGDFNTFRISNAELRAVENITMADQLEDTRQAAEVHRQVRRWTQSWIRPGMPLMLICDKIEKKLEELIEKDGLKRGQAFPTGCSINNVAAHFTPNTGDENIRLGEDDVMKVDFGTHVNGRIIDSAWTVAFNERYDPLLQAVKEATYEGVKQAGIDVRLGDIGAAIQEVMESYEVELDGKVFPVKSIRNLSGHSIDSYIIHHGKSVPIVRGGEQTKMEEGEVFAIETFGSTGRGLVQEEGDCSHFMVDPDLQYSTVRLDKAQKLLKHINQAYGTLPFCRKWLDREGFDRHSLSLNHLVDKGVVKKYPPLVDIKGSYTAQYEHTIILRPTCKEVLSKGDDY